jgi:hypothetical protein
MTTDNTTTDQAPELRECPFNCTPRDLGMYRLPDSASRHVFCHICYASGPWGDSDEEARMRWNQRATPPVTPAVAAKAVGEIMKLMDINLCETEQINQAYRQVEAIISKHLPDSATPIRVVSAESSEGAEAMIGVINHNRDSGFALGVKAAIEKAKSLPDHPDWCFIWTQKGGLCSCNYRSQLLTALQSLTLEGKQDAE